MGQRSTTLSLTQFSGCFMMSLTIYFNSGLFQFVLLLFAFHAKLGTTNNHRTGLADISNKSFFIRDSNQIEKKIENFSQRRENSV